MSVRGYFMKMNSRVKGKCLALCGREPQLYRLGPVGHALCQLRLPVGCASRRSKNQWMETQDAASVVVSLDEDSERRVSPSLQDGGSERGCICCCLKSWRLRLVLSLMGGRLRTGCFCYSPFPRGWQTQNFVYLLTSPGRAGDSEQGCSVSVPSFTSSRTELLFHKVNKNQSTSCRNQKGDACLLVLGSSLRMIRMLFAWSVWGKNTLPSGLWENVSTVIFCRSKCFVRGSLSSKRSELPLSRCGPGGRVLIWLRCLRQARPFLSWSRRIRRSKRPFLKSVSRESSSCNHKEYDELLEAVTRTVDRLKLDWLQERKTPERLKLDDRFLAFMEQALLIPPLRALDVDLFDHRGCTAQGYMMMPQVEETLAGYLSPGSSSSLKKPMLPTNPCRLTSSLVGKAYQAAGQAGAALHTMAVLQAYQADLLKDLSTGGTIDEEAFSELCLATDLSLRATKQMARAIGRSMAAVVSTERHLWLNLTGIKERDQAFLLDAPVSPAYLATPLIRRY
ncbi:putative hydrolase M10 [Labeo rohita]|uniref:Hydrolase M10 n=1 Tax=Labeo rohita TaxID=84645 RepID=A0ABQ8L3R0_LABRO|nr:putative hydrolase M10 [Labeo rohita]